MARDITRRVLFDTVTELYDELRPGYPEELADDVVALSGLRQEGRILEVGTGTGQATRLFASRGYPITSIELGANMAAKARENLKAYPNATVLNMPFEDWTVETGAFELVISGSAFHWIPPEVGFSRCAQALKSSGHLALFWNGDPKPTGGVYDAIQEAYNRMSPDMSRNKDPNRPHASHIERLEAFAASGFFEPPTLKEYFWSRVLTADQYVRLCGTYSDHIALPDDQRSVLFEGIKAAVNEYGGSIERQYRTRLYIAKKVG